MQSDDAWFPSSRNVVNVRKASVLRAKEHATYAVDVRCSYVNVYWPLASTTRAISTFSFILLLALRFDIFVENLPPVYKKGNVHLASNYRPVSLTCVLSKVMEHIISKHILTYHLDNHSILTQYQHGFRTAHSCESQLLLTVNDLMWTSYDKKIQADVAIIDFSRAFDEIHEWIRTFLCSRQMWVAVDGETPQKCKVDSGVPQGTVLGPLLFLIFINDLPNQVSAGTITRLFADDCLAYREIKTEGDSRIFLSDLEALSTWAEKWGMRFNLSKCIIIIRIHRGNSLMSKFHLEPSAKKPKVMFKTVEGGCIFRNGEVYPGV